MGSGNKGQGTNWERDNLNEAHTRGLNAMYLRQQGSADLGDLWINQPPAALGPRIAILAWKRLTTNAGGQRRAPLGERDMYILDRPTLWALLSHYLKSHPDLQVVMECKAAERLSVSRELADAKRAASHTGVGG